MKPKRKKKKREDTAVQEGKKKDSRAHVVNELLQRNVSESEVCQNM